MRIVDADARPGRALSGAAEAWVLGEDDPAREPLESPARTGPTERPALVLVPGTVKALRDRLGRWERAGVPRVARIHPGSGGHGYPLADWLLPPLPEVLDRDGWTLAIDPGVERPWPWEAIVALARRYPGLPVLALGAPLGDRAAAPALDATANLVLAVQGGLDHRSLRVLGDLVRGAGAHRVCLASGGAGGAVPEPDGLDPDERAAIMAATADALGAGTWRETWL